MIPEAAFAARKPKKRRKKRRDARRRCCIRGCTKVAQVDTAVGDQHAVLHMAYCKTHAKHEADKVARLIVMERDASRCVKCGSTEVVQWAHVIRRGSLSTRWLAEGAVALCRADHVYFTYREEEWRTWLDENRPGLWERLNAIRIEAADKRTQPDLAEIIASLRSQVPGLVGKERE